MGMCTLPGEIVDHIVAQCPGRTDEALQPRFGISYNTWRKIAAGEPNRATVAARLIERITAEKTRLS